MTNFVPIQNSTHFSLLNSISKPENLVKKARELGYTTLGLTDYNSVAGAIEFVKECKGNKKKNISDIKPILGTKLRISSNEYITLIAKNLLGWKTIIKLISDSNSLENQIVHKAMLPIEKWHEYDFNNIIIILGDIESDLYNKCFSLHSFCAKSENEAKIGISEDVKERVKNYIQQFTKYDIFLQLNLLNKEIPYQKLITNILRECAKELSIKCIAGVNTYYINKEDAIDLRLLICSDQNTTFNEIDLNFWRNALFFNSNSFYLPSLNEIKELYTEEEINNTQMLADKCEIFDITSKPKLPSFDCGNLSQIDYLKKMVDDGYKNKKKENWDEEIYKNRIKSELEVIEKANLAGYFLIVSDYIRWAKKNGHLVGPGRGSSGGSLICYLIDITEIDPIPYNLIFARFYNEGRNTEDNIEYPDIDTDFPKFSRESVINYIIEKYGKERVGSIVTYGRLQGRSALREVLRIHNVCDINTINQISKLLPHEHKVADKLEEDKETSIIKWTLKNEPKLLEEYVHLNEEGAIVGDMAPFFKQAIRIEGIYKSAGKHASGIVVCNENLDQISPLIWHDESKQKIIAYEMDSAKSAGLIKLDILGVSCLSKLNFVKQLLRRNK